MLSEEGFWRFAHERQAIWHRRFIERQTWPWSEDHIFQRYRFCNVHRELDFGTQVIITDLRSHPVNNTELVFQVLLYRLFNSVTTWPELGWRSREETYVIVDDLAHRHARGEKVFGSAWSLTGGGYENGKQIPIGVRASRAVRQWKPEQIIEAARTDSLEQVWRAVRKQAMYGGDVLAWQATLDLTYVFGMSDDVWIPRVPIHAMTSDAVGHGPAAVTASLFPGVAFQDVVRALCDTQTQQLRALGFDWSEIAWDEKPRLTLADIEHVLCDYNKYDGVQVGRRSLRKFIPRKSA